MTKQKLIDTIKNITDQSILDDIYRLLKLELDEEIFVTSTAQKSRIKEAQLDVQNNNTIDDQSADNEIDQWLNE